mgnify:CR=1 FL=1
MTDKITNFKEDVIDVVIDISRVAVLLTVGGLTQVLIVDIIFGQDFNHCLAVGYVVHDFVNVLLDYKFAFGDALLVDVSVF